MPCRISIVIPTYQRPNFLTSVLDALLVQTFPLPDFEVIVVDNESYPNAAVQTLCGEEKYIAMNLHYSHQSKKGLSCARNMGMLISSAPWIGYLDDDAIPLEDWVANAVACIESSGADIIGGPFYPFYTSAVPAWFRDEYGSGSLDGKEGPVKKDKYLFGGNLFIKRDLLIKLGGFSPSLGYVGKKEIYGEETELQFRAAKAGARIWYAPTLVVRHHFPRKNMRVSWFFTSGYRHGQAKALIYFSDWRAQDTRSKSRRIFSQIRVLVELIINLVARMFVLPFRSRIKYSYWQNYAIECVRPLIVKLGISTRTHEMYLSKRGTG